MDPEVFQEYFDNLQAGLLEYIEDQGIQAADACDLLQEAWLRMYQRLDLFDPRFDPNPVTGFRRWAFGFIKLLIREFWRARDRNVLLPEGLLAAVPAGPELEAPSSRLSPLFLRLGQVQLVQCMEASWREFLLINHGDPDAAVLAARERLVKFLVQGTPEYPLPLGGHDIDPLTPVLPSHRLALARVVLVENGVTDLHSLLPTIAEETCRGLSMLAFGGFARQQIATALDKDPSTVSAWLTRMAAKGKHLWELSLARTTERAWAPA